MELPAPIQHAAIRQELDQLDLQPVLLDGKLIKPSQCYRFSADPLHVLYNTNCPDELMAKIETILSKYKKPDAENNQ